MSESDPTPLILISFLLRQAHLYSKDERHGDQGLLTSTQLVHLSHLIVLSSEAHLIVKRAEIFRPTRSEALIGNAYRARYSCGIFKSVCLVIVLFKKDLLRTC